MLKRFHPVFLLILLLLPGACSMWGGGDHAPSPSPSGQVQSRSVPVENVGQEASYLQMGIFSARQNATALFDRVSDAGIAAYIVQSGGVYKVKSGPYVDADQALQRKMEIDRLLNIESLVVFER